MIALIATFLSTKTALGPKAAKAVAWLGILALAALVIWAAIAWFGGKIETARDEGRQSGVITERAETQGKVIENVQKAKAAADDVRRDGPTRDECLQDSRVRENC